MAAVTMATVSRPTCHRCNSTHVSTPEVIPATSAIQNRLTPVMAASEQHHHPDIQQREHRKKDGTSWLLTLTQ